jgi:uncharacterized protein
MPLSIAPALRRLGLLLTPAVAGFFLTVAPGSAADFKPSFDCTKARTPDERLICASQELSLIDSALDGAFRTARDALAEPDRAKLIAEQRQWVGARNRQCDIDRDTILQPRVFINGIPCMADAMRAREKVLEGVRASASAKNAAETFQKTGTYAPEAFNAPTDVVSDEVLVALVARIPDDASATASLESLRAAASEALTRAILDRFGRQWKAAAPTRLALTKQYICRDAVWEGLDADHLALEPKDISDLFRSAAYCSSLDPLQRLARHPEWLGLLSAAERDDIVTALRRDTDRKPIGRRDPEQLALERQILSDPAFTAQDWTAGEAAWRGVEDPEKALKALARFDSGRNLTWRAIYTRLATASPEESKAKVAPLITAAGARIYKPDDIARGFTDEIADGYEGTLQELIDWIAWMSSWTETPVEDPDVGALPCALLVAHPEFIDASTPRHGGMRDGSLPGFVCDGFGKPMPKPVSEYLKAADRFYLGDRYQGGQGTIYYSYMVEREQKLLRIRLLPGSYLNDPRIKPADLDDIPLARWSLRSLWNHTEFETRAKPLFLKARKALAAHYRDEAKMSERDAMTAAHLALRNYMEPTSRYEMLDEPESPLNPLILNGRPAAAIAAATDTTLWNDATFWRKTAEQDPPLQNAVTRPEVLKVLLEHKADPNIANVLGRTALMTAALYDNLESLDLLLAAGADVNRQSDKSDPFPGIEEFLSYQPFGVHYGRRTALMYAAANSKLRLIKALLAHGADKKLKDDWGLTAQDYLLGRGPVPANPKLSTAQRKEAAALLAPD